MAAILAVDDSSSLRQMVAFTLKNAAFAPALMYQADITDNHPAVDRLAHVINRQRRH